MRETITQDSSQARQWYSDTPAVTPVRSRSNEAQRGHRSAESPARRPLRLWARRSAPLRRSRFGPVGSFVIDDDRECSRGAASGKRKNARKTRHRLLRSRLVHWKTCHLTVTAVFGSGRLMDRLNRDCFFPRRGCAGGNAASPSKCCRLPTRNRRRSGGARGLYFKVKLIVTFTITATGFLSFVPGLNFHCFRALTAS